jgi:hypothetical protein
MDTSSASKKHEDQKAKVKWPVTLLTPHGPIDGTTENISISSVYVASKFSLPSEGAISLLIKTPDHRALHMTGQVVTTTANDSDDGTTSFGVELQLTSMSDYEKEFLYGIIANSCENKTVRPDKRENIKSDVSAPASTDTDSEADTSDVKLLVSYKKGGKTVTAEVTRFSSKGCIAFTKNPHRLGTVFSLKITNAKSKRSVQVDGSVTSRNYFIDDKRWGMSINFMNLCEEDTEKLRQVLTDQKQSSNKSVKSKYLDTLKGFVLNKLPKEGRFAR